MDDFTFSSLLTVVKRFFLVPTSLVLILYATGLGPDTLHKIDSKYDQNNQRILEMQLTNITMFYNQQINTIKIFYDKTGSMIT
ncbi:hypothetical protein [Aquimarina sp. MMG016]|uniref:hypothetical protein n=1 Tax=Aquimarina sp. MMG016 TaxID=2822690 RepID=UPI001B3A151C|nr:hypothetical protein [Aquimarina sp. MMG016]MBQ4821733.1 hypothetical protein [Aquimarina sp. MMG016]